MRSKTVLNTQFNELMQLYRYLYADKNHSVIVKNAIDVPLMLTMSDDCAIMCQNMNYPEFAATRLDNQDIPTMFAVIEQLKEQPAVEFPNAFASRWEEIKALQAAVLINNM